MKKRKLTNIFGAVIMVLSIILFTTIVLASSLKAQEPSSSLAQTPQSSSVSVQAESQAIPTQELEHTIPKREDIIFSDLKAVNADTLGYITVPNTVINYPVVKGIDNIKYLTTNFNGEYDIFGTVFADMFNSDSLADPVTVLYGHYEDGGTFFTQLHNYSDAQYFEDNPDIYLYTPYAEYKYEIVAAFINDNYSLMYEKNYQDKAQLQGFINHIANTPDETANLKLDDVDTEDKFLVLSTCMNASSSYENRYVVVGKLVYAQKTD